jgi:predicted nucleotidyltransferase
MEKKRLNMNLRKLTAQSILNTLNSRRNEIKKYHVQKIGLFGSYSKGTASKKSDLDFIVKFNRPDFDDYMELKFLLEKIFHKKVDLVTEESLKSALNYIKKEAKYVPRL